MPRIIKYSFEQWCIDNDRQDLLDRWDYDKNDIAPSEISYKSEHKMWFKCPIGIHESELKSFCDLAYGKMKELKCKKCNSYAQHVVDLRGADALNSIWDPANDLSPWDIPYASNRKIKLICEKNKTHKYEQNVSASYYQGCPFCYKESIKEATSLAIKYPDAVKYWSDDNDGNVYEYSSCSHKVVKWKCNNGIHDDYSRSIAQSVSQDFSCPKCSIRKYTNSSNLKDILGEKFGELTVIAFDGTINNRAMWKCRCSCGNIISVSGDRLRRKNVTTCGDKSIHRTGENNGNWKGGVTPSSIAERMSSEYSEWRKEVFKKDHYRCLICGEKNNIEAHHIYPFANFPDKRYDVSNGCTLCEKHHSVKFEGSFHNTYGCINNTPEQLEEYINTKRKSLKILPKFRITEYMNCENILKPGDIKYDNELENNDTLISV